ncbi:helix-turn-helix domain-containing protein [Citricoccus sp. NR2]|uniref:helix-turn-helix domain-containing protein n=1 Tax=Citricoccus sp. NR2 TaxID=3004095 RepID=UPI0022DCF2E9|nr:hypothetical protein [Citricoccus sp. NR2]WBL18474.1 hypothetical protein O1A05_12000 [Citricoccus sp. NR2]
MPTKLLSAKKIAEVLGENPQTTRKRLRRGEIKGIKKGTGSRAHWFATESAVNHFINRSAV